MSLDSAKGPSVTVFCLPFTTLPVRSSGCPAFLSWPFSPISFIQAIHFCMVCCICSGDAGGAPVSSLRYKNTNSLMSNPPEICSSDLHFEDKTFERQCGGHFSFEGGDAQTLAGSGEISNFRSPLTA